MSAVASNPFWADVVDVFREDYLSAWVPDVAAHVDAPYLCEAPAPPGARLVDWIDVPRPGNRPMRVPVLHPSAHLQLHGAVQPLIEAVDEALNPNVFGYRRGAQAGASYSRDWHRFNARTEVGIATAGSVVFADVQQFFASARWYTVLGCLGGLLPSPALHELRRVAESLSREGLSFLPAGYADARFLGNATLIPVDSVLAPSGFARWVDDYRIFVDRSTAPETVAASLQSALDTLGLRINIKKTRTIAQPLAAAEHACALSSVYQSGDESGTSLRSLRQIFEQAALNPIRERRALRFALPRLADLGDDIAVEFAAHSLASLPWEAPRLVGYLGRFVEQPRVIASVNRVCTAAALDGDAWLVARLVPLAVRMPLERETTDALADSLTRFENTPAWGLALRVLSVAQRGDVVRKALKRTTIHDTRSALVALSDLDIRVPRALSTLEPAMASALSRERAPLPPVESIL